MGVMAGGWWAYIHVSCAHSIEGGYYYTQLGRDFGWLGSRWGQSIDNCGWWLVCLGMGGHTLGGEQPSLAGDSICTRSLGAKGGDDRWFVHVIISTAGSVQILCKVAP